MKGGSDEFDSNAALFNALCSAISDMEDISVDLSDPVVPFDMMGLDSIGMLVLSNTLEERLGVDLPSHLMWDCPNLLALAEHLRATIPDSTLRAFISSEEKT